MTEAYIGEIRLFGGGYTPRGWLLCDGRHLPASAFPELFAVIGHRYGGDESTFAVPDLNHAMNAQSGVAYIIAMAGRTPVRPEAYIQVQGEAS
ncbi:MAG TPA: phage tail protein [Longimicrobiales bacterium]|nr:phage tail protein [Longimicrobiales bacterium]